MGHALGLGHPWESATPLPAGTDNTFYTLMSYNGSSGRSTFSEFDLYALSWIYGGDGVKGSYGIGSTNGPVIPNEAYPPVTHTLSASATTVSEADGQFSFTVTRSGELSVATTVAWSVGGAVDAADFGGALPSGVVSFAAGETTKTITFAPGRDDTVESNEAVTVTLGATTGQGARLGSSTSVAYSLTDDDAPPSIRISSAAQVVEGHSGSTQMVFSLSRSGNLGKTSVVNWTLTPDTANAADFAGGVLPGGGSISFAPGQTTATLSIGIAGDTLAEPNESFTINLTGQTFANVAVASAQGTIVADDVDNTFTVAAQAAQVNEGNSGTQVIEFIVTRSGVATEPVTVNWERGGTIGLDDLSGNTAASGALSFAAGETSKSLAFTLTGDSRVEGDESLSVTLQGVAGTGAGLGTQVQAQTTVKNDDAKGEVSVSADRPSAHEGSTGQQTTHNFTLTRSGDLSQAASIPFTVGGTTNGADFLNGVRPAGTATFAAGAATTNVIVTVVGDKTYEHDETIVLTLAEGDVVKPHPTNGTATVTLLNDDTPMEFSVVAASARINEGSATGGITSVRFEVSRSGDTAAPASIDWEVSGAGDHPVDGADFVFRSLPRGTLDFAAGEATKSVNVSVTHDSLPEQDETMLFKLLATPGVVVSQTKGEASVVVATDDPLPKLGITGAASQVDEGHTGARTVSFDVTRTGDTGAASSAQWTLAGASTEGSAGPAAADPSDFVATQPLAGTVSFAAGETRKTITVQIQGDPLVEPDEAFTVTLSAATGATLDAAKTSMRFTITNDDAPAPSEIRVSATGSAAANECVTLPWAKAAFGVVYDTEADAVKVTGKVDGIDGTLVMQGVDVLRFSDQAFKVLPSPTENTLLQLGQAAFGPQGLDGPLFSAGSGFLAVASVGALGELVAREFFAQASAEQMASQVLANLGVSAGTLGGADPQASYTDTVALLTGMFSGDAASRGAALQTIVQTLSGLEGDAVYGRAAATYNDRVGFEWVSEFAGHPAALVGVPAGLVEVGLVG